MAKVSGPLMSMDASGKLGNAIVFSKWKGRNTVRGFVIPANPRSAGQQTQRAKVAAAGRFVSFMEFGSPLQASANAAAPSGQSGAGYLVSLMSERYTTQLAAYTNGSNSTVKGYFDAAAASLGLLPITIPGSEEITVTAGFMLWLAYDAVRSFDESLATTVVTSATEASIGDFVDALSAA